MYTANLGSGLGTHEVTVGCTFNLHWLCHGLVETSHVDPRGQVVGVKVHSTEIRLKAVLRLQHLMVEKAVWVNM